jgi:hypothetical protein
MAVKTPIRFREPGQNDSDEALSLSGRTLEWKWLFPTVLYWRLKSGNEVLATVRMSKMDFPNYFFKAQFNGVRIEIRLQEPESINYLKRHPPGTLVTYSISLVRFGEGSGKGKGMKEIGTIEHGFDNYLSPSKFILNDYGVYYIECSFQDKGIREFTVKRTRYNSDSKVALISRSKIGPEWVAPIWGASSPGTFRLLTFEEDDPNPLLIAILGFVFAQLVRTKYDTGYD